MTNPTDPDRNGHFALHFGARFGRFGDVRVWFTSWLITLSVTCAQAQEQEQKLIDRILRPNLALQNPVQSKRFATEGAAVSKKVTTRPSRIPENALSKKYRATDQFSTREFAARHFRDGDSAAPVNRHTKLAKRAVIIDSTTTALAIRTSAESTKPVATSEYAGQRPFLGRGKSQEKLSKHSTPLTIEQVRELLNKNK